LPPSRRQASPWPPASSHRPGHAATKTEDVLPDGRVEDDARTNAIDAQSHPRQDSCAALDDLGRRNNELTQSLTVPAGISIKEGIRLFIGDGDPATFGYDVCGPRVCIARGPFGADLAAALKAADKASASYVVGSKQLMQVEFDLTGFGAAYDYLVSQLS
jgi:invasion protein IalB